MANNARIQAEKARQEQEQKALKLKYKALGEKSLKTYQEIMEPRKAEFYADAALSESVKQLCFDLHVTMDNLVKYTSIDSELNELCKNIDKTRTEIRLKSMPLGWAVLENSRLRGLTPQEGKTIQKINHAAVTEAVKQRKKSKDARTESNEYHDATNKKGGSVVLKQNAMRMFNNMCVKARNVDDTLDESVLRKHTERKAKKVTMEEDSDLKSVHKPIIDLSSSNDAENSSSSPPSTSSSEAPAISNLNSSKNQEREEILKKLEAKSKEMIQLYTKLNIIDGLREDSEHLMILSSSALECPYASVSEKTDLKRMRPVIEILSEAMKRKNNSIYETTSRYELYESAPQYTAKKRKILVTAERRESQEEEEEEEEDFDDIAENDEDNN